MVDLIVWPISDCIKSLSLTLLSQMMLWTLSSSLCTFSVFFPLSFVYFIVLLYTTLQLYITNKHILLFSPNCKIKDLHWWLSFTWAQPGIQSGISNGISNTLNTIKCSCVVERARLLNWNQLNSPQTEQNPNPSWFSAQAQANTHNIY